MGENSLLMNSRQRVQAVLGRREADRTPRFEIWIDALLDAFGQPDIPAAHAHLGQDSVMLPSQIPPESSAWKTGVDEFGRVWQDGMYVSGRVATTADLLRYSPSLEQVHQFFNEDHVRDVRARYPDHCLMFGTHAGPFTAAYMAMGIEQCFDRILHEPAFVRRVLEARTDWCIALMQKAVSLGAEVIIVGDDAAHRHGPMISPRMWRDMVLPLHRRIVESLAVPVIWHSDGRLDRLLPMAIEAGFVGVHGLEPAAGNDLAGLKREYGRDLIFIGNLDVNVLFGPDLEAVRAEVRRCLVQGVRGGGYMFATCNSIFNGMNPVAVTEMFRYSGQVLAASEG